MTEDNFEISKEPFSGDSTTIARVIGEITRDFRGQVVSDRAENFASVLAKEETFQKMTDLGEVI